MLPIVILEEVHVMSQGLGKLKKGSDKKNFKSGHIIDFNEARKSRLAEKGRKTERIFFKSLLSTYSVDLHGNLFPIDIIDVSEEGCSFQMPIDPVERQPKDAKDLPIRLYFSQETYLEIFLQIQNSLPVIDNSKAYIRFGCKVDKTTKSYPAYELFVKFLKVYSEQSHKDTGKTSVFYL